MFLLLLFSYRMKLLFSFLRTLCRPIAALPIAVDRLYIEGKEKIKEAKNFRSAYLDEVAAVICIHAHRPSLYRYTVYTVI